MVERRSGPRFLFEAPHAIWVGYERLQQDLDGNITAKRAVVRAVHFAHTAGPKQ